VYVAIRSINVGLSTSYGSNPSFLNFSLEPLLYNAADKGRKLRFLPPLTITELCVHEVQAFERVVIDDASEEMDTAFFAGVALDRRGGVDDMQFIGVGGHGDGVFGYYADDGEEGAAGLPAFAAAAGVIVGDVAGEGHFDFVGGAVAVELSACEVGVALLDTVVDRRVDRWHIESDVAEEVG
jgi:acetylornithine/succinyldiaminopimelate/putrescine aminotransferase